MQNKHTDAPSYFQLMGNRWWWKLIVPLESR